ncbi:hypothetical protein AN958_03280 [Leucoagaricus sp. SymC.cos]|nr:hypothetical protein AN958_03280 [Leucoagaricus sp. SymC.cos]
MSYPSAPDDVVAVRSSLMMGYRRLQAVEEEISRLQYLSHELSQQKQSLTTFVNNHRQLLSPSNRLPPDILQEIFYHCLPTAHNAVMSIYEPPLSLGFVCTRWRNIVYSTPRLWTSIHIVATPLSPPMDVARRSATSAWLTRSGILPLSISMFMGIGVSPPLGKTMNDLVQPDIDIVALHSQRWQSIHFQLYDVDWLQILPRFHSYDVPLLEHLHIDSFSPDPRHWNDDSTRTHYISALHQDHGVLHAPRLHFLALPGSLACSLDLDLQCERLTGLELKFSYLPIEKLLQLLSQCQNLVDCTISISTGLDSWDDIWPSPPTPSTPPTLLHVTLRALQSLTIVVEPNRNGSFIYRFLDLLSAPGLRHLSYRRVKNGRSHGRRSRTPTPYEEEEFVRRLRAFLDRLLEPLVELDLRFDSLPETTLLDMLRCLPAIKRLSITGGLLITRRPSTTYHPRPYAYPPSPRHPFDDSLLKHFIPGCEMSRSAVTESEQDEGEEDVVQELLCPNLEVLTLSNTSFNREILLQFLRSRTVDHQKHDVARLMKVNINSISSLSTEMEQSERQEIQQGLRELEKEIGLEAFINHPNPPPAFEPTFPPPFSYTPYAGIPFTDWPNYTGPFIF